MVNLTQEDRENIQNQITVFKENQIANTVEQTITVPKTPDGRDANEELNNIISNEAAPDKRESRRIKKKIRGIWSKWRTATLDAKSLEAEKIACEIEIKRAETQARLNAVRRQEEKAEAEHWLALNKGNLEDLGYNTTSKPSKFWYNVNRGCFHITKTSGHIPKFILNLLLIGAVIVGVILLKKYNVL